MISTIKIVTKNRNETFEASSVSEIYTFDFYSQ